MPGVLGFKLYGKQNLTRIKRAAAKSTAYVAGDLIVVSTYSSLTDNSMSVARPLLAGDISANYKLADTTTMAGILAFALHTESANASGIIATQPSVTNVAAAARPIYALPGYGAGMEVEGTNGHSQLQFGLIDSQTILRMALLGSLGAATSAHIDALAGVDLTSGLYTVDTGATDKCFKIVDIDDQAPEGNIVYVRLLETFQQNLVGVPYAAR